MAFKIIDPGEQTESFLETGLRNVARLGSRAVETAAGLPGDIIKGGYDLLKSGQGASKALQEKLGLKGLLDIPGSDLPKELPVTIPGSEEVKGAIGKTVGKLLPEGYLEPKGGGEKFLDDFAETMTSFITPIGGTVKATKALKMAGLGSIAKFASEKIGAGPLAQEGIKLGTMLLGGIGGQRAAKKYAATLPEKEGSEIIKALSKTSKIKDFMKNKVDVSKLSLGTASLLGLLYYNPIAAKAVIGGGLLAGSAEKAIRALSKSPKLRSFYKNAIKGAVKKNTPLMLKNINRLDDEIKSITNPKKGRFRIIKT